MATRKPSAYQDFMRSELKRLERTRPDLDHRQAFKLAAVNWQKNRTQYTTTSEPAPVVPSRPAPVVPVPVVPSRPAPAQQPQVPAGEVLLAFMEAVESDDPGDKSVRINIILDILKKFKDISSVSLIEQNDLYAEEIRNAQGSS